MITQNHILKISCLMTFLYAMVATPTRSWGDDWPQFFGADRSGVWKSDEKIIATIPQRGLKRKWYARGRLGFASPVVANGRVFLFDFNPPPRHSRTPLRVFADGPEQATGASPREAVWQLPGGQERVTCFDEKTGETLWKSVYDCDYRVARLTGPRATPAVNADKGLLFTLGLMGNLVCWNVENGTKIWDKDLKSEESFGAKVPKWGFASHLLVTDDKLIVLVGGSGKSAVVAFDLNGEILWSKLSVTGDGMTDDYMHRDDVGYSPPSIIHLGEQSLVIVWLPRTGLHALELSTGHEIWNQTFETDYNLSIAMPRMVTVNGSTGGEEQNVIFITSYYNGSRGFSVSESGATPYESLTDSEAVKGSRGSAYMQSLLVTPLVKDGYLYGCDSFGKLRCINSVDGQRMWSKLATSDRAYAFRPALPVFEKRVVERIDGDQTWISGETRERGREIAPEYGTVYMYHCIGPEGREVDILFNDQGELMLAHLSPNGYAIREPRAKVVTPTIFVRGHEDSNELAADGKSPYIHERTVCWSQPSFANGHLYIRNDHGLYCISLRQEDYEEIEVASE